MAETEYKNKGKNKDAPRRKMPAQTLRKFVTEIDQRLEADKKQTDPQVKKLSVREVATLINAATGACRLLRDVDKEDAAAKKTKSKTAFL
jgi:hypothetical protein